MIAAGNREGRRNDAAPDAAGWLGIVAAPTFIGMALFSYASGGGGTVVCSAPATSLWSGMVPMYALMGIFHSAPWLRILARRRWGTA
jgi:hypothetical protein